MRNHPRRRRRSSNLVRLMSRRVKGRSRSWLSQSTRVSLRPRLQCRRDDDGCPTASSMRVRPPSHDDRRSNCFRLDWDRGSGVALGLLRFRRAGLLGAAVARAAAGNGACRPALPKLFLSDARRSRMRASSGLTENSILSHRGWRMSPGRSRAGARASRKCSGPDLRSLRRMR